MISLFDEEFLFTYFAYCVSRTSSLRRWRLFRVWVFIIMIVITVWKWPNGTAYINAHANAIYSSEPFEKEMPTGKLCQASVKSIKLNSLCECECSIFTWLYIMFRVHGSLVAISLNDSSRQTRREISFENTFDFHSNANWIKSVSSLITHMYSQAVWSAFDRQNTRTNAYTHARTLICFTVLVK